ncbi:MAG: fructose-bisphosphate aldolase / 2-amino-3,7-dideoxy-D-threo-hept-6-ulosonate synthase [Thermoproteota archaeon]|nr:fructose-bisphosphate aldolase / 2-amino-3,7-dideoxy-D-threo-hept-6-ulosonate synthase [Thermoproteota archaeon]
MVSIGKEMRMAQIFADDGKTLVSPHESIRPGRDWGEVAKLIIAGGGGKPGHVLMTVPGILKNYYKAVAGKIPIILTVPLEPQYVDLAVKMGAVAVKWSYFGPIDKLPRADVQRFAAKCDEAEIPFYYEPVPMTATRAEGGKNITDPKILLQTCLAGASFGADFIKTEYSNSPETFKEIVKACPVPVTVLGGERISDDECLKRIKSVIDGGGAGGAFGRNVTTHPNPDKIVKAIMMIVHEGASVEEAKKILE